MSFSQTHFYSFFSIRDRLSLAFSSGLVLNRNSIPVWITIILFSSPLSSHAQTVEQVKAAEKVRVERLVVQAMTKSFLGYHQEAIEIFKKALDISPDSPVINAAISEEYEKLDDLVSAVHYATLAKDYAITDPQYHLQLARLYVDQNDYLSAEEVLENLLSVRPDDIEVLEELAFLQFANDQFPKALESYKKLEASIGHQQHISYRMLQIYYELNNVAGMEQTLLTLQELNPTNTTVKRNLADLYLQNNRKAEAIHVLENALTIDSTDVETIVSLAKLYEEDGKVEQASSLWNRAMQTTGSPEDAYARASHLYARSDQHPETLDVVIKLLEYAVAQDPLFTEALILLGNIRYEEHKFEQAGMLLYKAVQSNPRNPEVWLQAAAAYLEVDKPRRAADIADEALLLFPGQTSLLRVAAYGYMDAYQNDQSIERFEEFYQLLEDDEAQEREMSEINSALGLLYARKKDYRASDKAYELALSLAPQNAVVLNNLAYSLAVRETSLEKALSHAKKAVSIAPQNPSYMDTLGWVYFKLGELKKAEQWISKAIEAGGTTAIIYEHLGDIQVKQGNSRAAIASWSKSLEINPNNNTILEKIQKND